MSERSAVRLALAALAAALLLVACSDRVPAPPTPTATRTARPATPSPTQTHAPATPDFLEGVEVRPLRIYANWGVNETTSLIIELGCTQCDGPTTGFARVYKMPYTGVQFDVLLTPEKLPLPPATPEDQRYVAGFGLAPDGSDLVAGICVYGYCGGMGGPTANAEVWLFRSQDGGVTWSDYGHLPRPETILGWLGPGSVLTSYYEDESATVSYTVRPSGEVVRPPVNIPNTWPVVTSSGEVLWSSKEGRLFFSDGRTYVAAQGGVSFGRPVRSDKGDLLPFFWDGNDSYYLAQLKADGSVRRALVATSWINPEQWLPPVESRYILGTVNVPQEELWRHEVPGQFAGVLPALIDLVSGTAAVYAEPFLQPPFLNGRNHVVAVQRGPFARVVNTGDCLNVRDAPSTSGNILACLADGVLVRDSADVSQADGTTWAHVTTPSGTEGWVSTEYLER